MSITITTYRTTATTTARKAAIHAARSASTKSGIAKQFDAPRGTKGAIRQMAERIYDLRAGATTDPLTVPVRRRLEWHLIAVCEQQIDDRRLSTPAGWDEFGRAVVDRDHGLWLISGAGWYEYSRRAGSRFQSAAYLCGRDEGQLFAVRVPSTCETVEQAIHFLTPAAIREAQDKDIPVVRQGDIFFRPMRIREDDFDAIEGTRHEARARKGGGWTIVHPEHKPVRLSGKYTWRAYASTQVHGVSAD